MDYAALNLADQPTHPSHKTTPSTDDKGLPGSDPLTSSSQTYLVPPQLDGMYNRNFGTALLSPKTSLQLFSTLTEEQLKHESAYHTIIYGIHNVYVGVAPSSIGSLFEKSPDIIVRNLIDKQKLK